MQSARLMPRVWSAARFAKLTFPVTSVVMSPAERPFNTVSVKRRRSSTLRRLASSSRVRSAAKASRCRASSLPEAMRSVTSVCTAT